MISNIKLNHQIVYYHINNAKGLAMKLLSFGYAQFAGIYLYKSRIQLEELCENISNAKVRIEDKILRLQVKGGLPKTLGINILLSLCYTDQLGLGQEILKVKEPLFSFLCCFHTIM